MADLYGSNKKNNVRGKWIANEWCELPREIGVYEFDKGKESQEHLNNIDLLFLI